MPASTMTGTSTSSTMILMKSRAASPLFGPMGAASGMTAAAPARTDNDEVDRGRELDEQRGSRAVEGVACNVHVGAVKGGLDSRVHPLTHLREKCRVIDTGRRPRHDGRTDSDRNRGHRRDTSVPQASLGDRTLERARGLIGAVHADDDALDRRELLARGVAGNHDNRALRVRGQSRRDRTEETISEAAAPARSDDDHVDLCGEVNEYPRRVPGFGRAGHVRGAALASQGLGFLDDLFGARLQGLVIKDGVSAIEGGS